MALTPRDAVRSASTIGFATLISRILGFIRDAVVANLFGTSAPAQAFAVAFRIPNLLRDLVGEGAANAAVVPVLTEHRKKRPEEFWNVTGIFFNLMAVVLAALTAAGYFLAPWIVRIMAPGFLEDPAKFELTVRLTRWLFPYLWLIGLTALASGVLNTLHHFTLPAYGPCLLNLSMIAFALGFSPSEPVLSLAVGVLVGGFLQLAIQLPLLMREGLRLGYPRIITHPIVPQVLRLLGPRALGSCVYQLNLLVDTICASWATIVGNGAVAALYYANRLFQFPLAIVGTALAQASLPLMASQALESSREPLKKTVAALLRMTWFFAIPATVGLVVLGETIVRILFEHGEFTAQSTAMTAQALVWYAVGLFAYMGVKILTNACYALQDTKTPVRTAAVALVINAGLNVALMWPMGVGGLALATTTASTCNFILLWRTLRRNVGSLGGLEILASAKRVLAAALGMGLVCIAGRQFLTQWLDHSHRLIQASALLGLIAAAIGTFLGMSRLLRIEELDHLPWISKNS
ncbi:MAG: murein biosynthesis integral membrane protein MurJ [Candidatus Omnitrophica bacterium]|nr:murein biosynthesis integral membrane protein MurJ [Candidatus Omnitrophota bacterium]